MPQAKTLPAEQPTEQAELVVGSVPWLIEKGKELLREQRAVQSKIAANRRSLRDLDAQDALDENQGAWLDAFYPVKEKGTRRSEDQIKRSREVRAEALGVSIEDAAAGEDESENE